MADSAVQMDLALHFARFADYVIRRELDINCAISMTCVATETANKKRSPKRCSVGLFFHRSFRKFLATFLCLRFIVQQNHVLIETEAQITANTDAEQTDKKT